MDCHVSCLCHDRVCLLVVVAQWTVMLCVMFVSAHNVEAAIIDNVHQISEKVVRFMSLSFDSLMCTSEPFLLRDKFEKLYLASSTR